MMGREVFKGVKNLWRTYKLYGFFFKVVGRAQEY